MLKIIFITILLLPIVLITGCSELPDLSQTVKELQSEPSFEIIKDIELEEKWKVSQMRMVMGAGDEFSILLKLADDDRVDGFFYLEKGDDVDFRIEGSSLIYQSEVEDDEVKVVVSSDRFSFKAEQIQGTDYTLTFRNPANISEGQSNIVLYVEIIYPTTGYIFLPIEAW